MKRFIDIGEQTDEGDKQFAFYDTVRGEFETHNGSQTWCCVSDFEEDYKGQEIKRYLSLIPEFWPEENNNSPISVFAFRIAKEIEQTILIEVGNIKEENLFLQAKILDCHQRLLALDDHIAAAFVKEHFNIQIDTHGRID